MILGPIDKARELAKLEKELLDGPAKGSVISSVQIGSIRADADLDKMRFIHRLWMKEPSLTLLVILFLHKAAQRIGVEPMDSVTDEEAQIAKALVEDRDSGYLRSQCLNDENLLDAMGYILENPERGELIYRVVAELGINDIERIKVIVENSDGASASLTEGML